jgi:hypothetical protein
VLRQRAIERHRNRPTDRSGILYGFDPGSILFESYRDACFHVGGGQEARTDDPKSDVSRIASHVMEYSSGLTRKGIWNRIQVRHWSSAACHLF